MADVRSEDEPLDMFESQLGSINGGPRSRIVHLQRPVIRDVEDRCERQHTDICLGSGAE